MSGGSSSSSGGSSSTPKVKNKSHKGTERDRGDMGLFYKEAEKLFNLSSMEETIKEWRKVCKHHEGVCFNGVVGECLSKKLGRKLRVCRFGEKCKFSHDYDKHFPEGDACMRGTCSC